MLTDPATGDRSYRRFGTQSEQNNSSTVSARRHQVYAEAATGYTRHLGMDQLDVLLLYNIAYNTLHDNLDENYVQACPTVRYSIQESHLLQRATSYRGTTTKQKRE